MLVALGILMFIRPLALTHKVEIPHSDIVVRSFGNPNEALERIATENFTTIEHLDLLAENDNLPPLERMVYRYAPVMLTGPGDYPTRDDTFIGVYYLASQTVGEEITVSTIQYFFFSTDESGGTLIKERLALFGQPIDRELIYRLTIIDGEVSSAHFQAPQHRLTPYDFQEGLRPVFAVASANHNFRPVYTEELEQRREYQLLVPLPHFEWFADPAHDPDFIALAAREALEQYGVDLSEYLYIEFQNPVHKGLATISAKIDGRWYYLHHSTAGLTRSGYNQVGIHIGFAPDPDAIEELWLVAYTEQRQIELEVISVYIYPRISVES